MNERRVNIADKAINLARRYKNVLSICMNGPNQFKFITIRTAWLPFCPQLATFHGKNE
jgi:hypothetical protein